jgi:hypothetical protein
MKHKDVLKATVHKAKRSSNPTAVEEPKVWPTEVIGGKYVRILEKELSKLREVRLMAIVNCF